MRRYDDQLGQPFFERDHPQEVFAVSFRVRIGVSAGYPRALLALRDSLQLPYEVANKRVVRSVRERHEYDDTPRSVTERWYSYD